jgi:hypothetical protein
LAELLFSSGLCRDFAADFSGFLLIIVEILTECAVVVEILIRWTWALGVVALVFWAVGDVKGDTDVYYVTCLRTIELRVLLIDM